jgi:hypothetical protein
MTVLKLFGLIGFAYLGIWLLQFIWGSIGFCVLLRASRNNPNFIEKVLNFDNREKTKWLLLKWPIVLYRMKRGKQP